MLQLNTALQVTSLTVFGAKAPDAANAPQLALGMDLSRGDDASMARWLTQTLDHVGRGMLLLSCDARVLHANRMARHALDGRLPLHIDRGHLRATSVQDTQALHEALNAAMKRGIRRLLQLGQGPQAITVAVLPLGAQGDGAALLSLPHTRCGYADLAVHSFARQHSFTSAETAVLEALLEGRSPCDVAREKGVQLSTVRTQIGQLRQKCGAHSIRELVERVSALPPMMAVVQ